MQEQIQNDNKKLKNKIKTRWKGSVRDRPGRGQTGPIDIPLMTMRKKLVQQKQT